jgi:hypothetical protein
VLHLARKVIGAAIRATDGDIGTLEDFYFEEDRWTVRYLLVDTGKYFTGKKVLLSPMSVRGAWGMRGIPVALTKDQVFNSPGFDPVLPWTRDRESQILGYYGYPSYWGFDSVWGTYENPAALVTAPAAEAAPSSRTSTATMDPEAADLRSVRKSTGYHLHATDGEIGHVDDFLIGEESWRIRYMLVDTSNWIGGRSVIVASSACDEIDKTHGRLHLAATREEVKNAPSFESIESALDLPETGPPFTII